MLLMLLLSHSYLVSIRLEQDIEVAPHVESAFFGGSVHFR